MAFGAHMRPYSYMYFAPHRDGVLQFSCLIAPKIEAVRLVVGVLEYLGLNLEEFDDSGISNAAV